jgi:hypothetical protein
MTAAIPAPSPYSHQPLVVMFPLLKPCAQVEFTDMKKGTQIKREIEGKLKTNFDYVLTRHRDARRITMVVSYEIGKNTGVPVPAELRPSRVQLRKLKSSEEFLQLSLVGQGKWVHASANGHNLSLVLPKAKKYSAPAPTSRSPAAQKNDE